MEVQVTVVLDVFEIDEIRIAVDSTVDHKIKEFNKLGFQVWLERDPPDKKLRLAFMSRAGDEVYVGFADKGTELPETLRWMFEGFNPEDHLSDQELFDLHGHQGW